LREIVAVVAAAPAVSLTDAVAITRVKVGTSLSVTSTAWTP